MLQQVSSVSQRAIRAAAGGCSAFSSRGYRFSRSTPLSRCCTSPMISRLRNAEMEVPLSTFGSSSYARFHTSSFPRSHHSNPSEKKSDQDDSHPPEQTRYQKLKQSIGDKMENMQERVEEKLPERYEHLKQQEGETDSQHRRRLLDRLLEKVKEFVRRYGVLGVVLYFAIYFANIGIFFLLLESGIFRKDDIITKLRNWGLDKHFDVEKVVAGKSSSFALAWILTKFTEPLRMMLTISIVPYVYRGLVAMKIFNRFFKIAKP